MSSRHRLGLRLSGSLIVTTVALIFSAAVAFAYPPPAASGTLTSGCASVTKSANCLLAFHFVDGSSNPVTGANVTFTTSGVAGASVSPTTGITDAGGNVQTTFSAGSTGCGTASVTATSAPAVVSTTISVPCTGGATLPNTGTSPPGPSPWIFVVAALGVLGVLGGAITLRRTRATA